MFSHDGLSSPLPPHLISIISADLFSVSPGLDERDAAFMQRLRNLAHEALTWPHLGEKQRLVWAAALELEAVPFQELLSDSNDGRPGR